MAIVINLIGYVFIVLFVINWQVDSNAAVTHATVGDDGVTEFRVGVILINGHGAPYDKIRSAPAIDMAFDMVNREILNSSYRLVKVDREYGPRCDANVAPGK